MRDELTAEDRAALERFREGYSSDAGKILMGIMRREPLVADMLDDLTTLGRLALRQNQPDDDDDADSDWLLTEGFVGGNDEPDTDVFRLPLAVGWGSPAIQVTITYRNGEQQSSSASLVWSEPCGAGKHSFHLSFADNVTRRTVRMAKKLFQ